MPLPPEFHEVARKVNNWGRWGPSDEIGTVNLIDGAKVREAAGLVRKGRSFSLSIPLHKDGLQTGLLPGRINPIRTMIDVNRPMTGDPSQFCNTDDMVVMGLQSATHWDGLAHVSYGGRMYNGHPTESIDEDGASLCGIQKIETLVSRGVLLDVAASKGLDRLEPGYAISCEDLDAAEEHARAKVGRGDIVLVRTGQMQILKKDRIRPSDKAEYAKPCPGLTLATAEWLHARDVAAVAADNFSLEVYPGVPKEMFLPVHLIHIVEMGLTQGQNWDLEALAADCADDGVHEFLLEASPQRFVGAVGTMVNPVAIK
ncbi:MAG: cyclase family protein [Deltaproteobacteria bacterium]|nr:cyclase family protein [Deltaproteobacteria bacterium]